MILHVGRQEKTKQRATSALYKLLRRTIMFNQTATSATPTESVASESTGRGAPRGKRITPTSVDRVNTSIRSALRSLNAAHKLAGELGENSGTVASKLAEVSSEARTMASQLESMHETTQSVSEDVHSVLG